MFLDKYCNISPFSLNAIYQDSSRQVEIHSLFHFVLKSFRKPVSLTSDSKTLFSLMSSLFLQVHLVYNGLRRRRKPKLIAGRNRKVGDSNIHTQSGLQCIQVVNKLACWQSHWHCYHSCHHEQCCSSRWCLFSHTHPRKLNYIRMLAYEVSACSLVYMQNKGRRFVSIRSCNIQ